MSKREQQEIIRNIHSIEGGGGHLGINKTMKKLTARYFWDTMTVDTRNFIRSCHKCQQVNFSFINKGKQELHNIPVPSQVFSQIGIDIMHMPESPDGHKYVITAIDYLTKYVEMRALKTKTAIEVANFIYEELICQYGCSDIHITDQGREFCNEVNNTLLKRSGTRHRITSAYHPQANGLVERMNRMISEILLKTIKNQEDWVQALPTVAFAHRSSEQASTTCIPMQFLIGRQPTLPIDIKMKGKDYIENDLTEEEVKAIEIEILCQNINKLKKMRDEYILIGQSNIEKAQSRQKKAYDRRKNYVSDININDMVMRKLQKNVQRKGGKLEKKFAGPYKVVAKTVKGNCQLEDAKGKVLKTWFPINQLKKYLKRGDVGLESETSDDSNVDEEKNNGIKVQKYSQDSSIKRSGKYQYKISGSSRKRRKENCMGQRDVTGSQDLTGSPSKQNATRQRDVTGSQDLTGSPSKQNGTSQRDVTGSQDLMGYETKRCYRIT